MKTIEQTQKAEQVLKCAQDYIELSKVSRKIKTENAKNTVSEALNILVKDIDTLKEGL